MRPGVSVEGLAVQYRAGGRGEVIGLPPTTYEFGTHQVTAILGRSGCGKSTMLRAIAQLVRYEGTVRLDGEVVSTPSQTILYVPQVPALFAWQTVESNVMFGLIRKGLPKGEARRRAAAALEEMGIGDIGYRWPQELSGGQQQRVSLARALVLSPRVLLLDEPFSQLDAITRLSWHGLLRRMAALHPELKIVLVTHDVHEALVLAPEVLVLTTSPTEGTFHAFDSPVVGDDVVLRRSSSDNIVRQIVAMLAPTD